MSLLPISQAIPIVKTAIFTALAPLVPLDADSIPAVYWEIADSRRPATCIVFQSQDSGGRSQPSIGGRGWAGLIAIKVYAPTPAEVDIVLGEIELAMAGASAGTTADLAIIDCYPLTLPTGDTTAAGGLIYRIAVYPTA